jgi:hypothetical protein
MKRLTILLLFSVCASLPNSLCAAESVTVVLPPFTVLAGLFTIDSGGSHGIVEYARVGEVTPGKKPFEAGLRRGDELVAIFDRPVIGMKREEYESAFHQPAEPGEPKTFRFVARRGLLGMKKKRIDVTFAATPKKSEPNQTQSTTPAVTPPAASSANATEAEGQDARQP